MLGRTFGDHADVDGVVVGPERDEDASGAARDEEGFREVVRNLGLPWLDHARWHVEVVVCHLEEEVVAQVGNLSSGRRDVLALLGGHQEALEPRWERRGRGGVAVELRGQAVVEGVAHVCYFFGMERSLGNERIRLGSGRMRDVRRCVEAGCGLGVRGRSGRRECVWSAVGWMSRRRR